MRTAVGSGAKTPFPALSLMALRLPGRGRWLRLQAQAERTEAAVSGVFRLGYNWQGSTAWVFGVEADIQGILQAKPHERRFCSRAR